MTTRAPLMTDVVDSTALTEALGDAAVARLRAAHDRLATLAAAPPTGPDAERVEALAQAGAEGG